MARIQAASGSGTSDDSLELERVLKLPDGQKQVEVVLDGTYNVTRSIACVVPAGVTLTVTGSKAQWTTINAKGDLR